MCAGGTAATALPCRGSFPGFESQPALFEKMKIKICPRCGSTNVGIQSVFKEVHDICNDCGFGNMREEPGNFMMMPFSEIDKNKVKKLQEDLRKNKK